MISVEVKDTNRRWKPVKTWWRVSSWRHQKTSSTTQLSIRQLHLDPKKNLIRNDLCWRNHFVFFCVFLVQLAEKLIQYWRKTFAQSCYISNSTVTHMCQTRGRRGERLEQGTGRGSHTRSSSEIDMRSLCSCKDLLTCEDPGCCSFLPKLLLCAISPFADTDVSATAYRHSYKWHQP